MTIRGFDVSHHQIPDSFEWGDPTKWDWDGLEADPDIKFIIARATYGNGTADKDFKTFAELCRDNGLTFGAYLFYRQIHTVEEQMALFDRQLNTIGGLVNGDLFPTLDMEENARNGDGKPKSKHFSQSCRRIAESLRDEYGGCILYYSSYFPEYLGVKRDPDNSKWMKEDGYLHWLADYDRDAGNPRNPYTPVWHMHQPKPTPTKWYANGDTVIDHDVLHPGIVDLDGLLIQLGDDDVSDDAIEGEDGTDGRPGGAFPSDFFDAVDTMHEGAERTLEGLDLLRRGR